LTPKATKGSAASRFNLKTSHYGATKRPGSIGILRITAQPAKRALAKGTRSSPNEAREWFAAKPPEEKAEEAAEEYHRLIIDRKDQLGLAFAFMLESEAARERDEVARGERQADGAYLIKQAYVAMLLDKKYHGETGWDENGPYGAWEETIIRLGGSMLDAASNPNKAGKRK
jgi:hypothetical protein